MEYVLIKTKDIIKNDSYIIDEIFESNNIPNKYRYIVFYKNDDKLSTYLRNTKISIGEVLDENYSEGYINGVDDLLFLIPNKVTTDKEVSKFFKKIRDLGLKDDYASSVVESISIMMRNNLDKKYIK